MTVCTQNSLTDQAITEKIIQFRNSNPDSLHYYAKQLLDSEDICHRFMGKYNIATSYYLKGDYKASELYSIKTLREFTPDLLTNYPCLVRNRISLMGRLFWISKNQNDFDQAFEYLLMRKEAIELLKTSEPNLGQYYIHKFSLASNLALMKHELGLHEEAIKILVEADAYYGKLDPEWLVENSSEKKIQLKRSYFYNHLYWMKSSSYNIIADCYLEMNQTDSARVNYQRAYEVAQNFQPKHQDTETLYQLRMAKVLVKEGFYVDALELINRYDQNSEKYNSTQNINFLKLYAFDQLSEIDSALFYGKKFINYKKVEPSTEKNQIVVYNILASLYDQKNQMDLAYKYSEMASSKLKELQENTFKMNKSHYLYDFEQVKAVHDGILKKQADKEQNLIVMLSGSFVLLVVILFYTFRRKKSTTSISEAPQEKVTNGKTGYNIDSELEEKILKALDDLHQTKQFLNSDFTLQGFAKELETNSTYVSSIVNSKKKQTFKSLITEMRINYIIDKLRNDKKYRNYTIKALAAEVGYTNASAFTRVFKKHQNQTPSEFVASLPDD
jgi:AraC-like DNA-binding protein